MFLQQLITGCTLALLLTATADAKVVGSRGQVYPIIEKDAAIEIEERAAKVDWQKVFDPEKMRKKAREWRPPGMKNLPRATKNRNFSVDMTYTLPFDIANEQGEVVYPKGFTFNPLDYMDYPYTLVVIDAEDPDQLKWYLDSPYIKDYTTSLLVSNGSPLELSERLNQDVFFADSFTTNKFRLEKVPSIIKQKGKMMEVKEVAIHERPKKK